MVFSIHTFVQKTQLSLHIPDSMCFYMSMLIVMLFLFFFLNDTFCIIIHSPTGERKKEYFIQHCVGKNAFQDALCVFFNFIYSSDCRGSQPWRVRSLVAAAWTLQLQHVESVVVVHGFSCSTAYGILVSQLGIEPTSFALEDEVLTTGPQRSPSVGL